MKHISKFLQNVFPRMLSIKLQYAYESQVYMTYGPAHDKILQ